MASKPKSKGKIRSSASGSGTRLGRSPLPAASINYGSSHISTALRERFRNEQGGCCQLCGRKPVDVAHVIARTTEADYQIKWLHDRRLKGTDFLKNNRGNLICLCDDHHHSMDHGQWGLLPIESDIDHLTKTEEADFTQRRTLTSAGFRDPGRTAPDLTRLSGRFIVVPFILEQDYVFGRYLMCDGYEMESGQPLVYVEPYAHFRPNPVIRPHTFTNGFIEYTLDWLDPMAVLALAFRFAVGPFTPRKHVDPQGQDNRVERIINKALRLRYLYNCAPGPWVVELPRPDRILGDGGFISTSGITSLPGFPDWTGPIVPPADLALIGPAPSAPGASYPSSFPTSSQTVHQPIASSSTSHAQQPVAHPYSGQASSHSQYPVPGTPRDLRTQSSSLSLTAGPSGLGYPASVRPSRSRANSFSRGSVQPQSGESVYPAPSTSRDLYGAPSTSVASQLPSEFSTIGSYDDATTSSGHRRSDSQTLMPPPGYSASVTRGPSLTAMLPEPSGRPPNQGDTRYSAASHRAGRTEATAALVRRMGAASGQAFSHPSVAEGSGASSVGSPRANAAAGFGSSSSVGPSGCPQVGVTDPASHSLSRPPQASHPPGTFNPAFDEAWGAATAAGLLRGAYHIARPIESRGGCQASRVVAFLDEHTPGWHTNESVFPAAVWLLEGASARDMTDDPEADCYDLRPQQFREWLNSFVAIYTALSGRPPIIYADGRVLDRCLNGQPFVNLRGSYFWAYGPEEVPNEPYVPRPWRTVGLDIGEERSPRLALRRNWAFWSYRPDNPTGRTQSLSLSAARASGPRRDCAFGAVTPPPTVGRSPGSEQCCQYIATRWNMQQLRDFASGQLAALPPVQRSPFRGNLRDQSRWNGPPRLDAAQQLPRLPPQAQTPANRRAMLCDAQGNLPPEVLMPPPPDWSSRRQPPGSGAGPSTSGGSHRAGDELAVPVGEED